MEEIKVVVEADTSGQDGQGAEMIKQAAQDWERLLNFALNDPESRELFLGLPLLKEEER